MHYPVYKIENFEETIFKNNFYVNSFANHLKKHRFIEDLHRHNFYLLVTSMGYNSKEGKMSIHIIDLLDREKSIIMNFEKRIRDIISVDKKTFFISFETFGGIGILNF